MIQKFKNLKIQSFKWLEFLNLGIRNLLLAAVIAAPLQLSAQRKITFLAADKLEITADLYLFDAGAPYIILFHQENSSRGEYREIAPRLQRLGFNCLAVDLRSGKESNFVQNETAVLTQKNNLPATILDCEKDILAAMNHIEKTTIKNQYILFGSSFSASLAMKAANRNKRVAAVIAYSPGEYFSPVSVKDWLKDFDRLIYVSSTKREQPFVAELVKDVPAQVLTIYQPPGDGVRGAPALGSSHPQAGECWMSLMMFINKVKEEKYK
jgi:pimeloyl-ACP methyl ester carboxylesterase